MPTVFLDTNILLRHLLQDDPKQSPKATTFLMRVERGEIQARISELVILEMVFTLQRAFKQPRARIRENILPLLQLPGILLSGKRRWKRIFNLYVDLNLSFADAYHVVLMERLKISDIATFDTEFNRVPGIKRVEI